MQFPIFDFSQKVNYRTELFAGLTVAMTMIPESLAFSILAGLSPLTGLYAAFIMGIVTAIFGGRPGMVSGGAGATVIVLISLIQSHGVEYLFATVLLAGMLQIGVGILKFGKFIRLVPESVMYGFVNGLAVVIFISQLKQFKTIENGREVWLTGNELYTMLGLVVLTIVIVLCVSKISKKIPAALVAIIAIFGIVFFFQFDTKLVGDIASISGHFPSFHIPQVPFQWETLQIIFPYAIIMAGVGLIESLLTLNVADELTNSIGKPNQECLAQGSANVLNGLFTGMGGCAMIAQTIVNISAGSRSRLAGIIGALTILIVILFASSVVEKIPMAALTGVMIVVSFTTFNWGSLRIYKKMPSPDFIIMLVVASITIFMHNLAFAVLMGVVISALVFAWESAKRIRARKHIDSNGVKHYRIFGPLFFASITAFNQKFDPENDPSEIIIDFKESRISDLSAIDSIHKLSMKYAEKGKKVRLINLNGESRKKLKRAEKLIEIEFEN